MLHQELKNEIKSAMIAKDLIKLKALRNIVSALTNELISKNKKPQDFLFDNEVIVVIQKLAKQRKDSIEQFKKGNREDLVREEELELNFLEQYLPKMMEKEEILEIVKSKKKELGISDQSNKGVLMSVLMKELKGKADGSIVKEAVDSLF